MSVALYGWTERYVVPGGAGGTTGLDWANAFAPAQMVADLATGRRYNISDGGTPFTEASTIDTSGTPGTGLDPIAFRGWNAAQTAVATSFADMPFFNGVSLGAGEIWKQGNFQIFQGLETANGPSHGIGNLAADNNIFHLIESHDNGFNGIQADGAAFLSICRTYDNAFDGVSVGLNGVIQFLESWGHNAFAFTSGVSASNNATLLGCYLRDNGAGFSGRGGSLTMCTMDGNTNGASYNFTGFENRRLVACQVTNNTVGLLNADENTAVIHTNFFGNSADSSGSFVHLADTLYAVNPGYVASGSNDYRITEPTQVGVSVPLLGEVNIGAWQNAGGGGPPPIIAGMLRHPGMNGGFNA